MYKNKLLLINNSQVLMNKLQKILERENYSVKCAADIAGARELLMDFTPDGIILKNDLSDGKGINYCRELKDKNDVPIMLISDSKDDEVPALRAGANDFQRSPVDMDIFKARIHNMLNKKLDVNQPQNSYENKNIEHSPIKSYKKETSELQRPVTEAGNVKKKPKNKLNRVYIAVAICAVFVFTGIGIFSMLGGGSDYFDVPDGNQVPLADFTFDMTDISYAEEDTTALGDLETTDDINTESITTAE